VFRGTTDVTSVSARHLSLMGSVRVSRTGSLTATIGLLVAGCLAALSGSMLAPGSAGASGRLTAVGIRLGDHPAYVRVVVDFTGATFSGRAVEATDPNPFDGTAAVTVSRRGVRALVHSRNAYGIRVRLVRVGDRLSVRLRAGERRFKYLSYVVVTHNRLAIDLWKSAPPSSGAQNRRGAEGCLVLKHWRVLRGAVRASGLERSLFEHQFQLIVRASNGRILGRRSVAAASGRWRSHVRYRSRRRQVGTLESVDLSAKDGALVCIAQVRVTLPAA